MLAQEQEAPEGVTPLTWMLLTTMPVPGFEQPCETLMWYARRWGIEVLHSTLKSGGCIEQRQLGHADRIEVCLAIDLVVAWRIYYLNKLGREDPNAPCTVYFADDEWKALMVCSLPKNRCLTQRRPPCARQSASPPDLGGFLGRKCDGEPGTQTLWLGLQRLDDITTMWRFMTDATQVSVSSTKGSG